MFRRRWWDDVWYSGLPTYTLWSELRYSHILNKGMYWHWLYTYIFFLFCTHFHPEGGQVTFPSQFITDFVSTSRWMICGCIHVIFVTFWPTKFLSRRLGASLLCKDSDSGLADLKKLIIPAGLRCSSFLQIEKTISGPQSASYLTL